MLLFSSRKMSRATIFSVSSSTRRLCSLLVLVSVLNSAQCTSSDGLLNENTKLEDFTVKDDSADLLALPSSTGPHATVVAAPPEVIARNGPITQYRTSPGSKSAIVDNKADESSYSPVIAAHDGSTGNNVVYARYPWSRQIPSGSSQMAGSASTNSNYYARHPQQQGYQGRQNTGHSVSDHRRPFAFNVGSGTVSVPQYQSSSPSQTYSSGQTYSSPSQVQSAYASPSQGHSSYTSPREVQSPYSTGLLTSSSAYYPSQDITASTQGAASETPLLKHHPHLTSIDQHQKEQLQQNIAASTTAGFQPGPPPAHLVETVSDISEHEHKLIASALGSTQDIYKTAVRSPLKLVRNFLQVISKFSVPRDHYLNVISFAGIYMFLAIMLYGYEDGLQQKCEDPQAEGYLQKEWHYHVGRRFVPGMRAVDPKLQQKFLELFQGMYNDDIDDSDSGGSSSSEEDMAHINHLCPRDAFFFSMAPMHTEGRMAVQRLLVAQPTPVEVYQVSRDLLYKHKVHPKVWYMGLLGAAMERPDMTGFPLAHPLDVIPDWFLPADLIREELDRCRSGINSARAFKRGKRAIITRDNSTLIIRDDAPVIISYSTSISKANASSTLEPVMTTSTTRRPLYNRRTTTGKPDTSLESNSVETFVLDGAPINLGTHSKGERNDDYMFYDEEAINKSVEKYQSLNTKQSRYKPKKKGKKASASTASLALSDLAGSYPESAASSSDISGPATSASQQVIHLIIPSDALQTQQQQQPSTAVQPQNDKRGGGHGHKKTHGNKRRHKGKKKGKGKGKDSSEEDDDECIVVDGKVGRDNGIENKLWYYREDIQLNQHHWYWHIQHPVNATKHPDRRAELFFFSHRQILARYNAERLSNGLARFKEMEVAPGGLLLEPYHSHLADVASGRYWTPRHPKRLLRDIFHIHNPDVIQNILLKDVNIVHKLLQKAVSTGIMISRKGLLPISHTRGIEALANTVEATELSVNPGLYNAFGLHNMGHLLIALIEDPDWSYKKTAGVMGDTATAMRDPIFYPYHAAIDDLFERNKEGLAPYRVSGGEFPLLWKGVEILDIEVSSKGNGPPNLLRTFWTKKKFELAPGVDKSTHNDHAKVCAVHLAHEPFTFKIVIDRKPCTISKSGKGTIRIFMAPRFDEKGRRMHLKEQRRLMIQLDSFQAKLRVGRNIITRRSHDSSLTKPWSRSIREYQQGPDPSGAADFCGCGWPQHLYIPKGSPKGMPFDLFAMVTNFDEDFVQNDPDDLAVPETCNSPHLMCGHARRRYPDARPMGYPFDRVPYKTPIPCLPGFSFASVICKSFNLVFFKPIDTLEEFSAKASNMKSTVFSIKHIDKLVGGYYH